MTAWAFSRARDRAGSNSAARIAMMAMTTKSSMRVKAEGLEVIGTKSRTATCALVCVDIDLLSLQNAQRCNAGPFDEPPSSTRKMTKGQQRPNFLAQSLKPNVQGA